MHGMHLLVIFLVTDDRGLRLKASIVYSLYNLPTKVLSIQEFIDYAPLFLNNEEASSKFSEWFNYDLEHNLQLSNHPNVISNTSLNVF
jgi:hypothetical protein